MKLTGHNPVKDIPALSQPVLRVAVSPDGQILAASGVRPTNVGVAIWSLPAANRLGVLRGHERRVEMIAFDPASSDHLVTGSADGIALVWDLTKLHRPAAVQDRTPTVVIDLSAPNARQVRMVPRESLAVLMGHRSNILNSVFGIQSRIATSSSDGEIRIWNYLTGESIEVLAGHKSPVLALTFIGGGKGLASISDDGAIRYWKATVDPSPPKRLPHRAGTQVTWVRFNHAGSRVFTAEAHENLIEWDFEKDEPRFIHALDFPYLPEDIVLAADIDSSDQVIATVGAGWLGDGRIGRKPGVIIRDATTGVVRARLLKDTRFISVQFLGAGDRLLLVTDDGRVLIQNGLDEGDPAEELLFRENVTSATAIPSTESVAATLASGGLEVLNLRSNRLNMLSGDRVPALRIAASNDGRHLVTCGPQHGAVLWSVGRAREVGDLDGHQGDVLSCVFGPRSETVLTTSADRTARLWSVPNRDVRAVFDGHTDAVHLGVISPTGHHVATANWDGFVSVFPLYPTHNELIAAARAALPVTQTPQIENRIAFLFEPPDNLADTLAVGATFREADEPRPKSNSERLEEALEELGLGSLAEGKASLDALADELEPLLAKIFVARAYTNYRFGRYAEAEDDLDRAALSAQPSVEAFLYRAYLYEAAGEYDAAVEAYTAALDLAPRDTRAYVGRAYAYRELQNWNMALNDLTESLKINPSRTAFVGRAAVSLALGRCGDALDDLQRAADFISARPYVIPRMRKAFILATCPDEEYRDGAEAVVIMLGVMRDEAAPRTPGYSRPLYQSVLAAAYAEANDFEQAVRLQRLVVDQYTESKDEANIERNRERLATYEQGKPWRSTGEYQ